MVDLIRLHSISILDVHILQVCTIWNKTFVLSYVDDFVYWYTSEDLVKWFLDTPKKIFRVNLLGYAHWFMSIRIYQMKGHYISVYQDRYATSIVANYLDISTVKTSTNFYKTNLPYDMIFTKDYAFTSNEKV